jgi:hypothetical protein
MTPVLLKDPEDRDQKNVYTTSVIAATIVEIASRKQPSPDFPLRKTLGNQCSPSRPS